MHTEFYSWWLYLAYILFTLVLVGKGINDQTASYISVWAGVLPQPRAQRCAGAPCASSEKLLSNLRLPPPSVKKKSAAVTYALH